VTGPLLIVVTYPDGALPGALFRAFRRVRRDAERAGYNARIELRPASDVPAAAAAVITATAEEFPVEFDATLERLTASGKLRRGTEPPRTVAVHRGFRALGDRARLGD